MKVLITGAAGQVGHALTATAPGHAVVTATTRKQLDISDQASVDSLVSRAKPDLIINAAAYTAVDKAESEPELARAINETGVMNLARAAKNNAARLLHISTDFVFDGQASVPYSTDAATAPLGVYGSTKLGGEKAALATLPDSSVVLRTAWVYSASGRNFLLTMLRLMREHGKVSVVSDQIGTPTSADSIARAIWAISEHPQISGICHWTDAGVASWYDFAVAIAEEAAAIGLLDEAAKVTPIPARDYPTPARRPGFSVLDTSKTVDAIGIQPPHWRASLRAVLGEIKNG